MIDQRTFPEPQLAAPSCNTEERDSLALELSALKKVLASRLHPNETVDSLRERRDKLLESLPAEEVTAASPDDDGETERLMEKLVSLEKQWHRLRKRAEELADVLAIQSERSRMQVFEDLGLDTDEDVGIHLEHC